MLPTAKRVVTWRTDHTPRPLVATLDFVTAAGNMTALIRPLAVFIREPRAGSRFRLEYHNPASTVAQIVAATGFRFDAANAQMAEPPTKSELDTLKELDVGEKFSSPVNS